MSDPAEANRRPIPTRDEVVADVLHTAAATARPPAEEERQQLRRLAQRLRRDRGRFGLHFAICDDPAQRRRLTRRMLELLDPEDAPVELELTGREDSLLDALAAAGGAPRPLAVHGLERLLPADDGARERRDQTLRELQARREGFRQLGRPLLLWMPEATYALIGQRAVDFWSWQGGASFFAGQAPAALLTAAGDDAAPRFVRRAELRMLRIPFVGRDDEMSAIEAAVRAGRDVQIFGSPGLGKTDLAQRAADRLRDAFPDLRLTIPLSLGGQPRPAADGLRDVLIARDTLSRPPFDDAELRAEYRRALSGRRALFILDDAADAEAVAAFRLPPGTPGELRLIVTSRRQLELPAVEPLALRPLTPGASLELLESFVPGLDRAAAEQICVLCNQIPLAVRLAGGRLAEPPAITAAAYVEQLTAEGLDAIATPEESLRAVFEASYAALDPETARVFRALSVFPAGFDAEAAAAICDDPEGRGLSELLERGLVSAEGGRYRMLDLNRQFAGGLLAGAEREATERRHAKHYAKLLLAIEAQYNEGHDQVTEALARLDAELPNIQAGQAWSAARAASDDDAASLCNDYVCAPYTISLQLHPRAHTAWIESALAASRHLVNRRWEARNLGNLGNSYAALGEPRRAITFHEQALAIACELGDRRSEGAHVGNLGIRYAELGEPQLAITLYEQALAITRELGDRRGEATHLGNLGISYAELGEPQRAITLYEQALAIDRELGDRHGEAADLGALGICYAKLGELQPAMALYEQALAIARELGDRLGEALTAWNLGLELEQQGNLEQAAELMQIRVDYLREIGHPDAEKLAARLAKVHQKLRNRTGWRG